MSKKGIKTTCSYIEWDILLNLIDNLKDEGNHRMLLIIALGSHFGLRASDLLKLKWKDILYKDRFFLKEKKTGKERIITINSKLKSIINFVAEKKEVHSKLESYIFGNRSGMKPVSIQYLNRELDSTFSKYNIPVVGNSSSHSLRKSFGRRVYSKMGEAEHALVLLQEVLGHSSINCTRRYLGIRQEEINEVYLQL